VVNGANVPINIEYNPEESVQIVRDVYGNPTTYRYDNFYRLEQERVAGVE
jgi:hypothetical protein